MSGRGGSTVFSRQLPAEQARDGGSSFRLVHGAVAVALAWTLVALLSLLWNLYQHDREIVAIVRSVAETHLDRDTAFRHWGVGHGGVYVPVTKQTPPNPYLDPALVPEREIVTPSGRVLTLINPAYMLRQLYAFNTGANPPQTRIISLHPIRPQNAADPWEREALNEFARGVKEKSAVVQVNGQEQMRLMRPFVAEPGCLAQCHARKGYREGDIMGGISIRLPMAPFSQAIRHHTERIWYGHLLLWLLGLVGIGLSFSGMHHRNRARLRSLQALARSEQRFRSLIENALDIITVLDGDAMVVFTSPSVERVLGHDPDRLLGGPLGEILHPDDRRKVKMVLQRLAARPGESETFEMRCAHRDGSWRTLEAVAKGLRNLPPAAYVINSRDISQRKEWEKKSFSYQAQLRSLASRLSLAEEQVRRQIATGLHEDIGQNLSVINLKLGSLRRTVASPEVEVQLAELASLLDLTLQSTRNLTFELSPPILYDIGLEASIKWAVARFERRHGIACRVEDDGEPKPLAEDVRSVLFRSVLEALNNSMKHASAQAVTVAMRREEQTIRITVADDGVGFDPASVDSRLGRPSGFGLFSIRERLELLDGHLAVVSAPGQGTRLEMVAPLKEEGESG